MKIEKLSHKITFTATCITLTITFIFGAISYLYTKNNIVDQISKRVNYESNLFSKQTENLLAAIDRDISSMSKNLLVVNALIDTKGMELYMNPLLRGYTPPGDIPILLTLVDFEGKPVASNQDAKPSYLGNKKLLQAAVDSHTPYAEISKIKNNHMLLLAYPIIYEATGLSEGALVLETALDNIFLLYEIPGQFNDYNSLGLNRGTELLIKRGKGSENNFHFTNKALIVPEILKELQLNISYGLSLTDALLPVRKITYIYIALALLITFLTILASRLAAKRIAMPIISLSQMANQIAETGSPRTDIITNENGEAGVLARSFQKMLVRLDEAQQQLEKKVDEKTEALITEKIERTKTEEALEVSKIQWGKTFNSMDDIVMIQDKDLRIIMANKATHRLFGVAPGQLKNKYCYKVFQDRNVACKNCPDVLAIKNGKTFNSIMTNEKLGKIFDVTCSPIFDEKGNFSQIVHVSKDITKQKRLENELFQAHKMEAIGTMAGGIAHDYNNILAIIMCNADLALRQIPSYNPVNENIRQIFEASLRARDLVKQILAFSRQSEQKMVPLSPSTVIQQSLKLLRSTVPTTVEIKQDIYHDSCTIMADGTQLHQVLMNLFTNAVHAMDEKGTIVVHGRITDLDNDTVAFMPGFHAGTYFELSIADSGQGMDKKTHERIFDPFFTTKKVDEGTGMGLSIVHGIIKNHNGFIQVNSKKGRGTKFTIYFPIIDEPHAEKIENQIEENAEHSQSTEHILIIDDEEAMALAFGKIIQNLGYNVTVKTSSREALELFKSAPEAFDLVITDQTMPHLSGAEMSTEFMKIRPEVPIILCTGFSNKISKEQAKIMGIREFLLKPVDIETLTKTIRNTLDVSRMDAVA